MANPFENQWLYKTCLASLFVLVWMCCDCFVIIAQNDEKSPSQYRFVIEDTVSLKSASDKKSDTLGEAKKGELLEVLESKGDWCRIKPNDSTYCWIYSKFVKTNGKLGVCQNDNVCLRSGPGKSHTVVGAAKSNNEFYVVATEGEWLKIAAPKNIGVWINKQALDKTDISTSIYDKCKKWMKERDEDDPSELLPENEWKLKALQIIDDNKMICAFEYASRGIRGFLSSAIILFEKNKDGEWIISKQIDTTLENPEIDSFLFGDTTFIVVVDDERRNWTFQVGTLTNLEQSVAMNRSTHVEELIEESEIGHVENSVVVIDKKVYVFIEDYDNKGMLTKQEVWVFGKDEPEELKPPYPDKTKGVLCYYSSDRNGVSSMIKNLEAVKSPEMTNSKSKDQQEPPVASPKNGDNSTVKDTPKKLHDSNPVEEKK